ncbi:class I SAM-dependent methyltransferase [Paenibacillus aestuarii]|uniref:Class I SAM-dependent methyltransferase n=1 Tax=Paenibacillus aestuarii TaxID=516965 RepID=A0ABW0KIV0_9BACL|nr:class I SAM-dependent methyltransferase [Paenibacillus aestuarii]
MQDIKRIKRDFDLINKNMIQEDDWNHNIHYHDYLLRFVPTNCQFAVDIGCGTGEFARKLAIKSSEVYGFDVSTITINKAIEFSQSYPNITYFAQDVLTYPFQDESIDCFSSLAVLHHIDLHNLLPKLKKALKPGGTIIFLDLYHQSSFRDFLPDFLAIPLNKYYLKTKPQRKQTQEEILAMQEHMKHDKYLSKKELKDIYGTYLPNYQFKIHLFWRYSLIWKKSISN